MTAWAPAPLLALALALSWWTPPSAAADPGPAVILAAPRADARAPDDAAIDRARQAYDEASRAFYGGRLDEALTLAIVAWEAVPNASSALIVATVLAEQARPCDVLPFLLAGLELEPPSGEAAQIDALWTEQGPRCAPGYGWLALSAAAPDAWLDVGGARHALPLALGLPAGSWPLRAGADGHDPNTHTFAVTPGRGRHAEVALAERSAVPDTPPDAPAPVEPASPIARGPDLDATLATDDTLGWGLVIGGAAATVACGVLAGLAVAEADAGDQLVAGASNPPTASDRAALDASNAHARRLEVGAWVAGGVGLAALIAGAALLATSPDATVDGAASGLRLDPRPGGATLTFGGRF